MYLLGIDVGTTGTKVVLIDEGGVVVATATRAYPLSTPRPLWSEQDPVDWWRGAVAAIADVLAASGVTPGDVGAVGLTGQMHGLVLLDQDGNVLRPAILWNDQRTAAQCVAIHDRVGRDRVIAITGKPVVTGYTAPKILWVAEHEPEVFAAARTMLLPKDYVRFRLTGTRCTDVADASGTSLLDLASRAWSDEMVDTLEIPRGWLPAVGESPVPSAAVDDAGAAATGLRAGTPVVAGAGDQAAGAVGAGIVEPGSVSVALGTSGVVFAATGTAAVDASGALPAFCHAVPDTWHVMGVMLSAGGSLRWYRDTLAPGCDYAALMAEAATVPPGAEGLLFLPYLTGERTPHDDPDARGAFVGLTVRHGRPHLTRAVVEGISFGLRDNLDLVRSAGVEVTSVRLTGGGAASEFWRQVLADVFGTPVATVNVDEGAAHGAAILAACGAGVFPGVREAAAVIGERDVTSPGAEHSVYADVYPRYRALYPALYSGPAPAFRSS